MTVIEVSQKQWRGDLYICARLGLGPVFNVTYKLAEWKKLVDIAGGAGAFEHDPGVAQW